VYTRLGGKKGGWRNNKVCCSLHHHHESRPPLLEVVVRKKPVIAGGARSDALLGGICVALAIRLAPYFVVVVAQDHAARQAGEASRVELPALVRLQILALDAAVAGPAERAIQLVVMVLAIWRVVEHVEFGAGKGALAGPADEALLVIATS
jgi:hypothetical protein